MKGVASSMSSSSRVALVLGLLVGWLFAHASGANPGTEVFGDEGSYVDLSCGRPYDNSRTLFWQIVQSGTGTAIIILIKEPGQDIEIREDRYAGRLSLQEGNNLRISNLNRDDDSVDSTDPDFVGTYRCSQGAGQVGEQYSLRVRRTPEPPTDLAVTAVWLYSVEVEVTGSHDGLEPQSLCVWYRERGTEEWKKGKGENSCQNGVDEGEEITLRSTLPTANTPYQICVVAQNRVNSSRCENAYIQATTDSVASFNATIRLPSEPYKSPDPNHRENQELVSRIVTSINTALKPTHPDLEVEVIQFREGSVLADLKMSVGQREVQHVKEDFVSDVRSERLTGIDVDKNFVMIDNEIPPAPEPDKSRQENPDIYVQVLVPVCGVTFAVVVGIAAFLLCQRNNGTYIRDTLRGVRDTFEMSFGLDLDTLQQLRKMDAKLTILLPTPPATEKPISNVRAPDTSFHESADCKSIVAKAEKANSLVVSGPTGSGKTQGVLAYARDFADKNENAVMWFFGRSENEEKGLTKDTILEQGMELAKKLGEGNLTPEELPNKVMESLQNRQSKSLLIFDDVTATSGIPPVYLATNEKVAVFIVTRSANLDLNLPEYKMEGFADEDVLEYFKSHKKSVEIFKDTSDEDLLKLGIHFGNLPLGLTLARSYLLSSRTSVKGYLRQLEERSKGVPGELKEHEKAVYGAIPTSMEDRMSRSSQDMLKFTAILSQDRIPVFILSKALEIASGENPDKDEFIKEVEELSLARVEGRQEEWIDGRMISVHQQTQAAILSSLDEQQLDTMTKSLVQTFLEYFHKDTRKIQDGYINGLLLPHVEAVLKLPTISKLPEKFLPGLARLYETVGYMYCQKRLPEVAAPALDKAKEKISALVPLDTGTDADNIFQSLVRKGEELYDKEDVYSKSLKKRVLTTGDVKKVLKTKVPALSDEFSKAAEMGKPLTENQFKQLVGLQLAYNTEQMRKSFLVELTATVLYTSARRIFYFQGKERVQYRPTAEEDLNLSLELSRKLAEDQGLQILNKMLSRRAGTLYILKETHGKTPERQKTDFLQAIAGYQELIDDGNDYFENGVLKKIGDDDFHRMSCSRAIVETYRQLIPLQATTDQERADFIHLHDENEKKMVEFAEKQVKTDDKGNITEQPEMLPELYNRNGDFLIERLEKGFVVDHGTEDGNFLEKAKQWYNKALDVKYKDHHKAASQLGLAKVYTLMYEAEKSKADQNGTSATNGDTRIPMDGIEEKVPLVEKQPTLDEIHHLTNAKGDMNKCLEIYEEKLRNRTKDIQEAKKWNDRIVRHIDSLITETKEQETTVV